MEFFSSTISKEAITYATKVLKSSFIMDIFYFALESFVFKQKRKRRKF